jgi:hypothetical protein
MKKDTATVTEALKEAMKLEFINESKGSKGKIASLAEVEYEDLSKITDDLDDLAIKMINNRRAKFGRQPLKRGNWFSPGNRKPGKSSSCNSQAVIKCRHCKKEGHIQMECRTRIKKNAPSLDKNGKPFANQPKVASLEDKPEDKLDKSLFRHLNGFVRSVKWAKKSDCLKLRLRSRNTPTGSPHNSCNLINETSIVYKELINSIIQKLNSSMKKIYKRILVLVDINQCTF